jgi:outer membrane immunogenic protein
LRQFLAFSLCLLAGSAAADDTVTTAAPQAAPVYDWSGGYAGVTGGYGWMDGLFEVSGYPPKNDSLDGTVLGVFAGASTQFDNNIVLGLEGDLEYNIQDVAVTSAFGTFTGGVDWQGSSRLRLGYALDRVLLYTTAGWAATRLKAEFIGVAEATGSFHGYTLGAGVDYAVTDHLFGRLDYRYNDFGSGELDFGPAAVAAELEQHTVKLGFGMKF